MLTGFDKQQKLYEQDLSELKALNEMMQVVYKLIRDDSFIRIRVTEEERETLIRGYRTLRECNYFFPDRDFEEPPK